MAVKKRVLVPLEALNFFMADMQSGIGPFLGIFLLAHHWHSGAIGTVMTLGGISGMLMTAPFGALIDATKRKRSYVAIPGACAVLASLLVLISQNFWVIALSQVATAIAGAAIGPAVSGMTLASFARQASRAKMVAIKSSTMPGTWWGRACLGISAGAMATLPYFG
nr:MFS transporter [Acidisoma silvae]